MLSSKSNYCTVKELSILRNFLCDIYFIRLYPYFVERRLTLLKKSILNKNEKQIASNFSISNL